MWTENVRSDGVRVKKEGDNWVIVRGDQPIIRLCPCCDRTFPGAMNAKLIADHFYPEQQS